MGQLVVHHIPETRSERVIWLLEELQTPYVVNRLSYRGGDLRSPSYLQMNPFGMVPTVSIGGTHLRETGAIFAYLLACNGHDLAIEAGEAGYEDYLQWLHSAEATLFQPLAGYIMHAHVLTEDDRNARFAESSLAAWTRFELILDEHLEDREFVTAKRFSAADILIAHALRMATLAGLTLQPACNDYLGRLSKRPAFLAMLGK